MEKERQEWYKEHHRFFEQSHSPQHPQFDEAQANKDFHKIEQNLHKGQKAHQKYDEHHQDIAQEHHGSCSERQCIARELEDLVKKIERFLKDQNSLSEVEKRVKKQNSDSEEQKTLLSKHRSLLAKFKRLHRNYEVLAFDNARLAEKESVMKIPATHILDSCIRALSDREDKDTVQQLEKYKDGLLNLFILDPGRCHFLFL